MEKSTFFTLSGSTLKIVLDIYLGVRRIEISFNGIIKK